MTSPENVTKRKLKGLFEINQETYPIYEGLNTVGRCPNATVIIKNVNVSQQHAVVTVLDNKHFITEIHSSNGTFLNDTKLLPFRLYEIEENCTIKLAHLTGTYKKLSSEDDFDHPEIELTQNFTQSIFNADTQIHDVDEDSELNHNGEATPPLESRLDITADQGQTNIHDMPTQLFDIDIPGPSKRVTFSNNVNIHEMPTQIFCSDIANDIEVENVRNTEDVVNALEGNSIELSNTNIETSIENTVLNDENVVLNDENTALNDENTVLNDENVILNDENTVLDDENAVLNDEASNDSVDLLTMPGADYEDKDEPQSQVQVNKLKKRLSKRILSDEESTDEEGSKFITLKNKVFKRIILPSSSSSRDSANPDSEHLYTSQLKGSVSNRINDKNEIEILPIINSDSDTDMEEDNKDNSGKRNEAGAPEEPRITELNISMQQGEETKVGSDSETDIDEEIDKNVSTGSEKKVVELENTLICDTTDLEELNKAETSTRNNELDNTDVIPATQDGFGEELSCTFKTQELTMEFNKSASINATLESQKSFGSEGFFKLHLTQSVNGESERALDLLDSEGVNAENKLKVDEGSTSGREEKDKGLEEVLSLASISLIKKYSNVVQVANDDSDATQDLQNSEETNDGLTDEETVFENKGSVRSTSKLPDTVDEDVFLLPTQKFSLLRNEEDSRSNDKTTQDMGDDSIFLQPTQALFSICEVRNTNQSIDDIYEQPTQKLALDVNMDTEKTETYVFDGPTQKLDLPIEGNKSDTGNDEDNKHPVQKLPMNIDAEGKVEQETENPIQYKIDTDDDEDDGDDDILLQPTQKFESLLKSKVNEDDILLAPTQAFVVNPDILHGDEIEEQTQNLCDLIKNDIHEEEKPETLMTTSNKEINKYASTSASSENNKFEAVENQLQVIFRSQPGQPSESSSTSKSSESQLEVTFPSQSIKVTEDLSKRPTNPLASILKDDNILSGKEDLSKQSDADEMGQNSTQTVLKILENNEEKELPIKKRKLNTKLESISEAKLKDSPTLVKRPTRKQRGACTISKNLENINSEEESKVVDSNLKNNHATRSRNSEISLLPSKGINNSNTRTRKTNKREVSPSSSSTSEDMNTKIETTSITKRISSRRKVSADDFCSNTTKSRVSARNKEKILKLESKENKNDEVISVSSASPVDLPTISELRTRKKVCKENNNPKPPLKSSSTKSTNLEDKTKSKGWNIPVIDSISDVPTPSVSRNRNKEKILNLESKENKNDDAISVSSASSVDLPTISEVRTRKKVCKENNNPKPPLKSNSTKPTNTEDNKTKSKGWNIPVSESISEVPTPSVSGNRSKAKRSKIEVVSSAHSTPKRGRTNKQDPKLYSPINDTPPQSSETLSNTSISALDTPSRQRRKQKPKVVFTMMDDPQLESLIRQLGGSVVDSVDACTVLVTEHVKRTQKLLMAVGQGKPICSPQWLLESKRVHDFLDPCDFILTDREAERKWNFSLKESIRRAASSKLLENFTVQLMVNNAVDVLKGAISACGGKPVMKNPPKNFKGNLVIVADPENKTKYSKLLKQNPPPTIVAPEAILDGVLRQELNFEDHLIS